MSARHLALVAEGRANVLARPDAVPRLRPGERPIAIETELSPTEVRVVRKRAHTHGLGVDALIAVMLEYSALRETVGAEQMALMADRWYAAGAAVERIVAPELRGWQRLLAGRLSPPEDDLPIAFIPLRLAAAIAVHDRGPAVLSACHAADEDVRRAVGLEVVATAQGVPMQTFVLAEIARHASRSVAPAL
jgi:hypothetical protein